MVNLGLKDYDGDEKKLDAAMRFLLWFIPKSYALMSLADMIGPESDMSAL